MARRPYSTWVRPFRDSDVKVRIRWYPARPEDGTLPFPSRINSLDWMTFPETHEGVGEVYGEARNYNSAKPIPGPKRDHICGTKDEHYRGGVIADPRPPMAYLPSGLPTCCEPGRREAEVRASVDVRSIVSTSTPYTSEVRASVTPVSLVATYGPYASEVATSVTPVSLVATDTGERLSVVPVAVAVLSEASTTPGPTRCGEALATPFGTGLERFIGPPDVDDDWLVLTGWSGPGEWHIRTASIGSVVEVEAYQGPACGSLALLPEIRRTATSDPLGPLTAIDYTAPVAGTLWLRFIRIGTGGWGYRVATYEGHFPAP